MFKTSTFAYWCCQFAGWGLAWSIYVLNGFNYHTHTDKMTITCVSGFLATHLLRTFLRRYASQTLPFPQEGPRLLLAIFFTAGLATALKGMGLYFFEEYHGTLTSAKLFLLFPADYLLLIVPWTMIYFGYRFISQRRTQTIELRRLEWRLKEMQTRADKSAITVEDLMGEINHILALIDENPGRVRNEITAFSRLLRESYLD
jgi:hypothetical protein